MTGLPMYTVRNIHFLILSVTIFLHLNTLFQKQKHNTTYACILARPDHSVSNRVGGRWGGSENYMIE